MNGPLLIVLLSIFQNQLNARVL